MSPDQRKHIFQEFLTRKGVGNELRRGATNEVVRIFGVICVIVWRIWKRLEEAQENGSDNYPH